MEPDYENTHGFRRLYVNNNNKKLTASIYFARHYPKYVIHRISPDPSIITY